MVFHRVCRGYKYLLTRGAPSCMWRRADFQGDPWIYMAIGKKIPYQKSSTFTDNPIIEGDVFFYHTSYQKKTGPILCIYNI